MYNQTNYDALGQQTMTAQQMQAAQNQQLNNIRNIQLQKLKQDYPETQFLKEGPQGQDYRVPLKIHISPAPLFIKITISPQFPYARPMITIMSRVQHQNIDEVTFAYKGLCLNQWKENSFLAQIVKQIEIEFNQNPPIPVAQKQQASGQPVQQNQQAQYSQTVQKQRYNGEIVNLPKPQLAELKRKFQSMNQQEIQNLMSDQSAIKKMYFNEAEVKAIKQQIERLLKDLNQQSTENVEERQELQKMFDKYEQGYQEYLRLKDQNELLKAQQASIAQVMSKDKVTFALNRNANEAEDLAKVTEKSFLKKEIDIQNFTKTYIQQRQKYHTYQILKVKVNQS